MDTHVLDALADSRRRAIIELLANGEACLCDISSALGISDPLASHHVKKLRESGLVICERRGLWLHCRLDYDAVRGASDYLTGLAERAERDGDTAEPCCAPRPRPRRSTTEGSR